MRLKKAACLLLALCVMVFSGACAKSKAIVLDISGAGIPPAVYAYFLNAVIKTPGDYGLSAAPDEAVAKDKAADLCKTYVAANTLMSELGISLTAEQKSAVSERTNGLWQLFSGHFESIGVTKQALYYIESANAAAEALLYYYFDSEAEKAATEEAVKSYYSENYISFISINGYLTKTDDNGNTTDLTADETAALTGKFEAMKARVANGESVEAVGEWFAEQSGTSTDTVAYKLIKRDGNLYPDGFFEDVAGMTPGTPGIITREKYIFLVMKNELSYDSEEFYSHRTECLKALKGGEIERLISDEAAQYAVVTKGRAANRVYRDVIKQNAG